MNNTHGGQNEIFLLHIFDVRYVHVLLEQTIIPRFGVLFSTGQHQRMSSSVLFLFRSTARIQKWYHVRRTALRQTVEHQCFGSSVPNLALAHAQTNMHMCRISI